MDWLNALEILATLRCVLKVVMMVDVHEWGVLMATRKRKINFVCCPGTIVKKVFNALNKTTGVTMNTGAVSNQVRKTIK